MATGDVLVQYPTAVAMTITLSTPLTTGSARESTAVNNTSTKYDDALLSIKTKGQTGGTGVLEVWGYSSLEKGTLTYTDGATGTDAAFTAANIKNSVYIGSVRMDAANSVQSGPFYLASAFGGRLPPRWGIILKNSSGASMSTTAGDHLIEYQGTYLNVSV